MKTHLRMTLSVATVGVYSSPTSLCKPKVAGRWFCGVQVTCCAVLCNEVTLESNACCLAGEKCCCAQWLVGSEKMCQPHSWTCCNDGQGTCCEPEAHGSGGQACCAKGYKCSPGGQCEWDADAPLFDRHQVIYLSGNLTGGSAS